MTKVNSVQVEAQYAIRDKQIYSIVLMDVTTSNVTLSPLYFCNDEKVAREQLEKYQEEYKEDGYQVILMKQVA